MIDDYGKFDAVGCDESSELFFCDLSSNISIKRFIFALQDKNPPGTFLQIVRWKRLAECEERIQATHTHEVTKIYYKKEQNISPLA